MQLPAQLAEALNLVGFTWPEADEELLFAAAQAWFGFADRLRTVSDRTGSAGSRATAGNSGEDFAAFERMWTGEEGPRSRISDGVAAAELIGAALLVMAVITLAQKIITIVQLVILVVQIAQAIAAAVPTGGASLGLVPVYVTAARVAIRKIITEVVQKIVREVIPRLLKRAKHLLRRFVKGADPERLFRKAAPRRIPGPRVPMNIRTVRDVARRYGVDIRGVRFNFRKDLQGGYFGETLEDGSVDLTRSAFSNEYELAKTLAHERFHVEDLRRHGYPTNAAEFRRWEDRAEAFEKDWWDNHPLNPANRGTDD